MPKLYSLSILAAILMFFCMASATLAVSPAVLNNCRGITFARNLSVGSYGGDVACLQSVLNQFAATKIAASGYGSPGNEGIVFNDATKAALIKYQKINYLVTTGSVDAGTRDALNYAIGGIQPAPATTPSTTPATTTPAPAPVQTTTAAGTQDCSAITFTSYLYQGKFGAEVKCLQVALNKDSSTAINTSGNGSPGKETSYFGLLTKLAVKKYQQKNSIAQTGTVGPLTRTKLNASVGLLASQATGICGDNKIQAPNSAGFNEICDGTDLGINTCVTRGYTAGGQLSCSGNCLGFDTSKCTGTMENPPILKPIGSWPATADSLLEFFVYATDADNDTLTYSSTNLPAGATFSNQKFSWTPSSADLGSHSVTFIVSDGRGGQDSQTINIFVSDATAPPVTPVKPATPVPVGPPVNIALGKSYTLEPVPNGDYDGSKYGGNDYTTLTDGIFTNPGLYMWGQAGSLSWGYTNELIMTFDLGSDQPISSIKYSTVSLAEQGIFWPTAVYVLASQDGQNYYFVTDLMQSDPNIPPVPSIAAAHGLSTHYVITASGLDTHARYIKTIVIPSTSSINIDEIQIFNGGKNLAYSGPSLPAKDTGAFGVAQYDSLVTLLKWRSRIAMDIAALKTKAASAGVDLTASLNAIQTRAQNFSDYGELSTFKSIIPLPSAGPNSIGGIQRDLIKLNAQIFQAKGNSGLALWRSNRWDNIDMYTSPSLNYPQSISLNMMNQEQRGDVFNISNGSFSDKTVTITLNGISESGNSNFVKLYSVGYVDTNNLTLAADFLQEVANTGSGYIVNIPAGMTQQFWIQFAPAALGEGSHSGNISVTDGVSAKTLGVNLSIGHYTFSGDLTLTQGGWENFNAMYYGSVDGVGGAWNSINTDNYASIKKIFQDAKIDTSWGEMYSPSGVQASWFDQNDILTLPSNYFNTFDRWARAFPNQKMYYLWADAGDSFAGTAINTDQFYTRVSAWIDAFTSHLVSIGVSPDRVALFTQDEPNSATLQARAIYWGRAYQGRPMRPNPRIQVYTDVTLEGNRASISAAGDTIFTATDILSPGYTSLALHFNDGGRSFPFYKDLVQNQGKKLEFYGVSDGHFVDPYTYPLALEWDAFRQGATGLNQFYAITSQCNYMNEYIINNKGAGGWSDMVTPLYLDDSNPDPSQRWRIGKHWQAMFEGREDYEYLHILSGLVDYMTANDPTNPLIQEAQALLISAPDAVVWGAYGNNYQNLISSYASVSGWSTSKDRSVEDTQRNFIWNEINKISIALNINSLP
jgi:peptidoglycan hydrolase-like protein with peptidoglycan-binding domain